MKKCKKRTTYKYSNTPYGEIKEAKCDFVCGQKKGYPFGNEIYLCPVCRSSAIKREEKKNANV